MPENNTDSIRAYIVSTFHQYIKGRTVFYAIGRLENGETFGIADDHFQPFFYIRQSDLSKCQALSQARGCRFENDDWTSMDGETVIRVSHASHSRLRQLTKTLEHEKIRTYEADIRHTRHVMMHRGFGRCVRLTGEWTTGREVNRSYINPEIIDDYWDADLKSLIVNKATNPNGELLALQNYGEKAIIIQESDFDSRKDYLQEIQKTIHQLDPDIICGWSIVAVLDTLEKDCEAEGLSYNIGRTHHPPKKYKGQRGHEIQGRQCIDIAGSLNHIISFEDMSLENLAIELLDKQWVYDAEKESWAAFHKRGLELIEEILQDQNILELTLKRTNLTGLSLEGAWGSVAAFDFLYISDLHRRKIVAPSFGVDRSELQGAPGGLVFTPDSGLYKHIFVFDFKSLYPSIMRTFNIDPQGHAAAGKDDDDIIVAPNAAIFSREHAILPAMLETFFERRSQAKADDDPVASYMYKIIMNSFYGVLGGSCRFASRQLAGAITSFGHHFLKWTKALLEENGSTVLYGDTDSLFVDAGLDPEITHSEAIARGNEMCEWLNKEIQEKIRNEYKLDSYLDLEFEKYYRRLVLPPARGSQEQGRAKGYAGHVVNDAGERSVEIIGMEAIRHDWTDMAQQLQRDLLDHIFADSSSQELEDCVSQVIRDLKTGKLDDALVYRKRLRKPVEDYTKSTPPHVKAARLMENPSGLIHYVLTTDGPRPIEKGDFPIDYDHYLQKQIAPIARTLASIREFNVEAILTGQEDLF